MRTDSFHLSNEFVNSTNKYISSNYGNNTLKIEIQNQQIKRTKLFVQQTSNVLI